MRQINSIFFLLFLLFSTHSLYSQNDNVGSGRAISFDGATNYIDFGDRYSDLKLPFTISAWVRLDPSNAQPGPIFTNRNCDPVYTGFRLIVNNNVISLDYGDGFGGNSPAFRRGKIASVTSLTGKWNHVTAVVRGPNDMDLYLNGVNVGGDYTGGSLSPMDSGKPGFTSTGYFISNGVIYRFKGIIDEMRLWNRAISETEIRQTMCVRLTGAESGLIGYWDFNETSGTTVFDKSPNKFNGQFVGNPQRVFSGAPIGDVSTYKYSNNGSGNTLSLQDNDYKVDVKNISVEGIQIYEVKSAPSQTTGLDLNNPNEPYFGVFLVSQNSGVTFDVDYYIQGKEACGLFLRDDNSKSFWTKADNPLLQKAERGEFVNGFGSKTVNFDLGADKILCNNTACIISTQITDDQFTFQWNTGQTTSSISVHETGVYSVKVVGYCGTFTDSIKIVFEEKLKPFSLGDDMQVCSFDPKILRPVNDSEGLTFLWQDGSTDPTFKVDSFGEFWVRVENSCGQESDTIRFSKTNYSVDKLPNVITPNGDTKNDYFVVDEEIAGLVSLRVINRWGSEVYYSSAYSNKWNGEGLSSGVYYIVLEGACIEQTKGSVTIIR